MDLSASQIFSRRMAHWTSEGLSGAALYEQLAADEELPICFDPIEAAAIRGITPVALKKERHRGAGPDFIRPSARAVRYPRAAFCQWLASRYVKRAA